MTIIEVLKNEILARLSNGNRWLVWDSDIEHWIVYERKPYAKRTKMLIVTEIESSAVEKLLED